MGRVLRHFLIATALLGTTTGQGNNGGLVGALLNSATSANPAVSAGASINLDLGASSAIPSASANDILAVSGSLSLNLNLGSGKTGISSSANANPTSGSSGLLGGLGDTVNGVGGAVNNAVSGVGSAVVAVVTPVASGLVSAVSGVGSAVGDILTPVASGLQSVASNAGQMVDAVGDTADSAVAVVPPIVSGAGNTISIAAVEATGLVGGLLDITLDTVGDVLTNVTVSLLTSAPVQVADELVSAILHPHPRDPNLRGWQYFGCFNPSLYLSTQAILQVTNVSAAMSASICINLCIQNAMDFATTTGNQCYCSNSAPGIDSGTDRNTGTNKCKLLCQDSLTEYCGGAGTGDNAAISVYKRVVSLITVPEPAYPANWTYNSCFYLGTWLSSLTSLNSYSTTPSGGTDGVACSRLCYTQSIVQNVLYSTSVVSSATCYCSTLTIDIALWAGIGECSKPCTNDTNQSCGGTSKLGLALGISYIRRAAAPTTTPPVPGTSGPSGWYNWGCYYGAAYLLDTILTGFQVSSLLNLDPISGMSGELCVFSCRNQGETYAMTIGGICFCNDKQPTQDLKVVSQLLCNKPCPAHNTERCGGEGSGSGGPRGRSLISLYSVDEPPVSGISVLNLLLLCSNMVCSVLCQSHHFYMVCKALITRTVEYGRRPRSMIAQCQDVARTVRVEVFEELMMVTTTVYIPCSAGKVEAYAEAVLIRLQARSLSFLETMYIHLATIHLHSSHHHFVHVIALFSRHNFMVHQHVSAQPKYERALDTSNEI